MEAKRGPEQLQRRVVRRPQASRWQVLRRLSAWFRSYIQYIGARIGDRLRGDASVSTQGVRLRQFFERLGAIANKIGQQLAVRVDFLPAELCNELGRLMDDAPAFPLEVAIERIEATIGCPVGEVFRQIDPEPIGSASISVVWRGELLDGTAVAIKVRRPGIVEMFAADLAIIDLFTHLAEATAAVRGGFFQGFRYEMRDMLMSELDFSQEADCQALFRRMVKHNGMKWVTAPRVFGKLSSSEVMVSEFVRGYPCIDILKAVEGKDRAKLQEIKRLGIDPAKVGSRVLDLGFWMRLESFFFHADPHPGNIFVHPGNKLSIIDFGSCGMASSQQRVCEFEIGRRITLKDIGGAANASLASLTPLPDLDVERVRRMTVGAFWLRTIDVGAGNAEWWERTTASMWLSLFNSMSEFQMPIQVDILRLLRVSLLTDTLAYRLNHDLDLTKAWTRWNKRAQARSKMQQKRQRRARRRIRWSKRLTDLKRAREILERGSFWGDRFIREIPREVARSVSRLSFTASLVLRLTLLASVSVLGVMVAGLFYGWSPARVMAVDAVLQTISHPAGVIIILLVVSFGLTKIKAKLAEKGSG